VEHEEGRVGVLAVPLWIAAALVAAAGAHKVMAPASTADALRSAQLPSRPTLVRAVGAVEVLSGGAVLLLGGRFAAAGLGLTYLAFLGFLVRLRDRAGPQAGCSCFGVRPLPVTGSHLVLDGVAAAVAVTAVAFPVTSAPQLLASSPGSGLPALGALVLAAVLVRLLFTELPPLLAATRALTTPEVRT
jgi:hypothetical protein